MRSTPGFISLLIHYNRAEGEILSIQTNTSVVLMVAFKHNHEHYTRICLYKEGVQTVRSALLPTTTKGCYFSFDSLGLSMGVIALTAIAGFAGDNITSVNLNVDWFNYI